MSDFSFGALRALAIAFGAIALVALSGIADSRAQEAKLPTKDIVAELTADFDADGIPDRLILTRNADGGQFADLHVFKGMKEATGKEGFRLLSVTREFGFGVFNVEEKRKGVIIIESSNAQGRHKWEQMLTIAWRGGRLVVLGITHSGYDSIDIDNDNSANRCDLNLSTGKGTNKKDRPVKVVLKPVPVSEWTDEKLPKVCTE